MMTDPYTQNPAVFANVQQQQPVGIRRIPQYFYPRYNEPEPYPQYLQTTDQPYYPVYDQPPPAATQPPLTTQPPLITTPYVTDPYAQYPSPYLVPLSNNVRFDQALPPVQQTYVNPNAADLAARKQDADLSRLEVYHFTPKPPTISNPAAAAPVIQYHVYSYPPGNQAAGTHSQQTQLPPINPMSNFQNPAPIFDRSGSNVEMKARAIQTEGTDMKTRGVSPVFIPERRTYDDHDYHRPKRLVAYNDRYDGPKRRGHQRHYQDSRSLTPIDDCRCLDCRLEREKTLNYYDD